MLAHCRLLNINRTSSCQTEGFTLVEILLVLAIMGIICSFGLLVSMDSYRMYVFNLERDTLVSLLMKTRSQSINNIDQKKHGIHFESNNYVVFEGDSFNLLNTSNYFVPRNPNILISGSNEIIFDQLSGDPNFTGAIILADNSRTAKVFLNELGQINW